VFRIAFIKKPFEFGQGGVLKNIPEVGDLGPGKQFETVRADVMDIFSMIANERGNIGCSHNYPRDSSRICCPVISRERRKERYGSHGTFLRMDTVFVFRVKVGRQSINQMMLIGNQVNNLQ
jgi:hypothetical protein